MVVNRPMMKGIPFTESENLSGGLRAGGRGDAGSY
jgi:hypothetical protein